MKDCNRWSDTDALHINKSRYIMIMQDYYLHLPAFVYIIIVKVIIIILIIIIIIIINCITSTVAIYHSYDLNSANIIISIPSFPTSIKISLKWSLLKLPARGIDKNKREEYCIKSKVRLKRKYSYECVRFALFNHSVRWINHLIIDY